jgi:cell division protein FtsI (penicillin-binding protein 3)
MRISDYPRGAFLLLGAGSYAPASGLHDVPSVAAGVDGLRQSLVDTCGVRASAVTTLIDPVSNAEMEDAIAAACERAQDLLFIYYAGHGLLSSKGDLHLASTSTRKVSARPVRALAYDVLREHVLSSAAKLRVIVLDCCYSGTAIDALSGDVSIEDLAAVDGTFVLTSSGRYELSLAPAGERYTSFTGELLSLIQRGDERDPPIYTLEDLYSSALRRLRAKGCPEPRASRQGSAGSLVVAPNVTYAGAGPAPRKSTHRLPKREIDRRGTNSRPLAAVPLPPAAPIGTDRVRSNLWADSGRVRVLALLLSGVLGLFCLRLVQLHVVNGSSLSAQARANRTVTVSLPAHRGDITDASGALLAQSEDVRNVVVDQTVIPLYQRLQPDGTAKVVGVAGAAEDLARILGLRTADVKTKISGRARFSYLVKGISAELGREVVRLPVPGVFLEPTSRRNYPLTSSTGYLVGSVSASTGKGIGGVEEAREDTLAGQDGSVTYERGLNGVRIPTGTATERPVQQGRSIRLTIDSDLQRNSDLTLQDQVTATGALRADVVILDAKSARILAFASIPDSDDQRKPSPTGTIRRPLMDPLEPGAAAKAVTFATALDTRTATPLTRLTIPEELRRADATVRTPGLSTSRLTVAGAIAQSNDIAAILTGEKIPAPTMHRSLTNFGFGAPTGLGLPESPGTLPPIDKWTGSLRYTALFGQGTAATAIQAASVFATIANDGVRIPPRLISAETGSDGVNHTTPAPSASRVIRSATARQLRLMMEGSATPTGSASRARVDGYRVAGMSANKATFDSSCSCVRGTTESFIGMAPAENPSVVIAVIAQLPTSAGSGNTFTAKVFQRLMGYTLTHRKIRSSNIAPPAVPLTWR